MTSDQRSYLHKNIIFLVITLILKHAPFILKQKYLIHVTNCLLRCMNWYSWGVIRSSHCIRTRSHRIRIVVILQPNVAASVRMHSDAVLSFTGPLLTKTVIKNNRQQQKFPLSLRPDTCESVFSSLVIQKQFSFETDL